MKAFYRKTKLKVQTLVKLRHGLKKAAMQVENRTEGLETFGLNVSRRNFKTMLIQASANISSLCDVLMIQDRKGQQLMFNFNFFLFFHLFHGKQIFYVNNSNIFNLFENLTF